MDGAIVYDEGEGIRIRIRMSNTGEIVMDLREGDPEFDNVVEMFGILHQVRLMQMEHDLNADCTCSTCARVIELKNAASDPT